jgi:redox-sensitive bicupin YhaK (pirin superfamily)
VRTLEGGGFLVRRPFPTPSLDHLDPFLLLDEMGPSDLGPGEAKGAPDHPHRGFETVTYLLSGRMEHKDSGGRSGKLAPGDVQWMTAGAGVVHSEMPEAGFLKTGGRMHGFQLWVNLPRRDKMMKPRYQEIPADRIPSARSADGKVQVKVIAGEALGARAVIETRTPILYLHFTLEAGARVVQPVPADYNVFAYVVRGAGTFGPDSRPASEGEMVVFRRPGQGGEARAIEGAVAIQASVSGQLEMLVVGGVPLGEPVERYGPFVMNTKDEIRQAIEDYQAGRMGAID